MIASPALRPDEAEERLLRRGLVDPFIEGQARFARTPVTLESSEWEELGRVAERIAEAYDEAVHLVVEDPELLDSFYELTPVQKAMWQLSAPFWHVFGRVDLFRTSSGWKTTELNCDTPTGQAEALTLGALYVPPAEDPNRALEAHFVECVLATATHALGRAATSVGIVFPTDQPEDLALIRLYRDWFSRAGLRVALGSPFNLKAHDSGGVHMLGERCDLVLRHYKTDWWGERVPVFSGDAPFRDPLPLARELMVLGEAEEKRQACVVNPFASVVPQNKRTMALMWEYIDRFSPAARLTIETHVPYTQRLEALHAAQVVAERERWVLKSDFGAEGDEVVLGSDVPAAVWADLVGRAMPGRWIVQERFEPEPSAAGEQENLGVYVFGGATSGVYARTSRGATDRFAKSAPVRVAPAPAQAAEEALA